MKKTLLTIICALLFVPVFSQQFEWVQSRTIGYNMNPALPRHQLTVSSGGLIFEAGLDSMTQLYGSDIYGMARLSCFNSAGNLQWSFPFGEKVLIGPMCSDASGNVYVSGSYMETFHISATDSLENTGTGFNTNTFILSFNSSGTLLWKRNITLTHSEFYRIDAMNIDQLGNAWYGSSDFFSTSILRLNSSGADVQTIQATGSKTLGGFSFDPAGNLFIAGSSEMGTMQIADLTVNVPETYSMYIARVEAGATHTSWIKLAHDVTFQSPCVVTDPFGNAYLSGNLMDSTVWGNITFRHPQWVYDIYLVKVDAAGDFHWGVQVPQTPTIVGDFERGANTFMDVDQNGNVFLGGTTRYHVDWGNGVVSGSTSGIYSQLSFLSFDSSGTARWCLNGGSGTNGYNQALSSVVNNQGEYYFTAAISSIATFGNINLNAGGGYAAVLGKINLNLPNGISSPPSGNDWIIYPNPSSSMVYFPSSLSAATIEIFDAFGRCVQRVEKSNSNSIDVSTLANGIYILRISQASGVLTRQFIVNGRN